MRKFGIKIASLKEKGGESMTTFEAWEKYKHLNQNLSDRELLPESFWGSIILDLWSAIKDREKIEEGG